jgi:hypothetical protein
MMTKQERQEKKTALRAEFKADFQSRFPRLKGKRLNNLVKTKADMALAEFERNGVPSGYFMGIDLAMKSEPDVAGLTIAKDGEVVQQ